MENHNKQLGENVSRIKILLEEFKRRNRKCLHRVIDIIHDLKDIPFRLRKLKDDFRHLDNIYNKYPDRRRVTTSRHRDILDKIREISEEKKHDMKLELNHIKEQLKNENNVIKDIKNYASEHNIDAETVTECFAILKKFKKDIKYLVSYYNIDDETVTEYIEILEDLEKDF